MKRILFIALLLLLPLLLPTDAAADTQLKRRCAGNLIGSVSITSASGISMRPCLGSNLLYLAFASSAPVTEWTVDQWGRLAVEQNSLVDTFQFIDHTATWADGVTPFTMFKSNITDSLSTDDSKFIDFQVSGSTRFAVNKTGFLQFDRTITAIGTTGNQTIDKPAGTINIAAAAASVTLTNSLITANSIILPVVRTKDATCTQLISVVPASGSAVFSMNAGCTAATSIGFVVTN